MRRRRRPGESAGHERWLVSYADFITLLFAFFVVMYALSQQDRARLKAAAESIRQSLGGGQPRAERTGAGEGTGSASGSTLFPQDAELARMESLFRESARREPEDGASGRPASGAASASGDAGLELLRDERGLVARVSAADLYGPGEIEVRPDFEPLIERIGKAIASTSRPVRVEGHADADEAQEGPASRGGWELSASRAAEVVRHWIRRVPGIRPERLAVSGFSHHRPLSSGSSEVAHGRNRRVEIVVGEAPVPEERRQERNPGR